MIDIVSTKPVTLRFKDSLVELIRDTLSVAKELFLILIPVIVVVKLLSELGGVHLIASLLSPLMSLVGLSGELGIVFATAILANLYGAIAALLTLFPDSHFSIREMTVLCSMMLICHSLPVELALTKKVGGGVLSLGCIRFFGAFLYGFLFHQCSRIFELFESQAIVRWVPQKSETSFLEWIGLQVQNLLFILVVLFCLLALMRVLNSLGVTQRLASLLLPLLRIIGISKRASSIAVFGLLAGITFGSGLLLAEIKRSEVEPRDIYLVLAFLSLCHGIIEDTALMLLLGASIWGVLFGRIVFSLIFVTLLAAFLRVYSPTEHHSPVSES